MKSKRGGKREGSGRPAARGERKETTSMRLTPTVIEYLKKHEETAGEVVESTLRRTADFKRWKRGQSG